jgi:hypothetical protein
MSDVFINHARADAALAGRIKTALEALGLTVWHEQLDLDAGTDVVTAIQQAIEDVGCVLTLWTPASVGANWVRAEAMLGFQRGKLVSVLSDVARDRMPKPFGAGTILSDNDPATIAERVRAIVRANRPPFTLPPRAGLGVADLDRVVAPNGGTDRAFVSYASEDEAIALELTAYLEKAACPCWVALRDIDAGEDYRTSILRALASARFLVLVYTAHANVSFDVANELLLARKRHKRRLVLKMDDSEPDGPLEYELATVQWIDGREPHAQAFERLAARAKAL